jgi:DNA-3-methyladenine glycosylase II
MSEDHPHYAHLRADPQLGPVVEEHGPLSLDPAEDLFDRLVRSIVYQQVSTAAGNAIHGRLREAVEISPAAVLAVDADTLRGVGLSSQKTEYVHNVATAFQEKGLSKAYFEGMDEDRVVAELTEIKGIGVWTAKMQLMFTLGRPDVFPVEDLGIRRGMEELFGDLSRGEMVERSEPWRPYRSYAALYLWRVVD